MPAIALDTVPHALSQSDPRQPAVRVLLPAGWEEDDLDDLRAAKGILAGIALSLVFWLAIGAGVWTIW